MTPKRIIFSFKYPIPMLNSFNQVVTADQKIWVNLQWTSKCSRDSSWTWQKEHLGEETSFILKSVLFVYSMRFSILYWKLLE